MRTKGKGQQFDRLWGKLNDLYDIYWYVGKNIRKDLEELKDKAKAKTPISDYEIKDKNNLLEQVEMLILRNELLQQEIKLESEN